MQSPTQKSAPSGVLAEKSASAVRGRDAVKNGIETQGGSFGRSQTEGPKPRVKTHRSVERELPGFRARRSEIGWGGQQKRGAARKRPEGERPNPNPRQVREEGSLGRRGTGGRHGRKGEGGVKGTNLNQKQKGGRVKSPQGREYLGMPQREERPPRLEGKQNQQTRWLDNRTGRG